MMLLKFNATLHTSSSTATARTTFSSRSIGTRTLSVMHADLSEWARSRRPRSRALLLSRQRLLVRAAADPRIQAPAGREAENYRDLVRHRRVRHHHGHAVIMRAYPDVVLMVHRDVDQRAGTTFF